MKLATSLAAFAAFAALSGCVTSEQQISAAPTRPRPQPAVVAVQPPPPAVVVRTPAPPPAPPVYVSAPSDVYIAGVVDRDVVFVGGSTYLWVVGPDGKRHRHFYARGDRRAEVFRRRENLRAEMAHRGGRPPVHAMVPPRRDEHRPPAHGGRSSYARDAHRPEHHDGVPARHAERSARVAEQRGHVSAPHDQRHPPRVNEAQQSLRGHAGA